VKILSPKTTGEACPGGQGVFQVTFSVALHFMGRFFSSETPSPVGPRQAGQLAAEREIESDNNNSVARVVMAGL
ncbi:MAG: hypothetical protein EBY09_12275, partial [Verrucomicrobia bacterium]|nr:hypothetical protein [Verrucomicrobiota bacterium]NDE99197.1 hypothetical protein [Verrucomicrobiota bacterium]